MSCSDIAEYCPEPKLHMLKCWPEFYSSIQDGTKTFEYRRNDRDFKRGERLLLREWNPDDQEYTGQERNFRIGFIYYVNGNDEDVSYAILSLLPDY